jgi:hypothetical protein
MDLPQQQLEDNQEPTAVHPQMDCRPTDHSAAPPSTPPPCRQPSASRGPPRTPFLLTLMELNTNRRGREPCVENTRTRWC